MNGTLIQTFLMLAQTGRFTETADRLFATSQTINKQLTRLETELGCTLFLRERNNLTLTKAGEIYYNAFKEIEQCLSRAKTEADLLLAQTENRVVIGELELLNSYHYFAPYQKRFLADHPDISCVYHNVPLWVLLKQLRDGLLDLGFLFEEDIGNYLDELDFIPLAEIQYLLVVSSTHPLAGPGSDYLTFRNETVFYSADPAAGKPQLEQILSSVGFPTDHLEETDNIMSSCSMVEAQQGIAFITEGCRLLDEKRFRTYPTGHSTRLVLAYRRDNRRPLIRQLLEDLTGSVPLR